MKYLDELPIYLDTGSGFKAGLDRHLLAVVDPAYSQYSGSYVLSDAQSVSARAALGTGVEDDVRDWMDANDLEPIVRR